MQICPILNRQETVRLRSPQHRFVIARGLTPGEHGEGLVARLAGIFHHSRHIGGRQSSHQMMSNLQHVRLKAIAVDTFEGRSDLLMDTLSSRRARLVIKHMPDQRMGELERLSLASKQVLAHTFFQQVQQSVLTHTAHRAQTHRD